MSLCVAAHWLLRLAVPHLLMDGSGVVGPLMKVQLLEHAEPRVASPVALLSVLLQDYRLLGLVQRPWKGHRRVYLLDRMADAGVAFRLPLPAQPVIVCTAVRPWLPH